MKYQVSEQTRLRQITSEIFVSHGLDAALNIDRESFNFAHPHYQILSNWVHRGLRQLSNTHKGLSDEIREQERAAARAVAATRLETFAARSWSQARRGETETPPDVEVVATPLEAAALRKEGVLAFERSQITAATMPTGGKAARDEAQRRTEMLKAIATVLDGYGLLEGMPYAQQHELLNALLAIFFDDAQDA
jgi:hypothetical protein